MISIPQPCRQDWNAMAPKNNGRHCSSCAKTVVDFTGMTDEAVQRYLLDRLPGQVCGRFRNDQVQRINIILPVDILEQPMPLWKRFLVAGLLAFSTMLFSCEAEVQGKAIRTDTIEAGALKPLLPHNEGRTMGAPEPVVLQKNGVPVCIKDTLDPGIMGEIAFPVDTAVKK